VNPVFEHIEQLLGPPDSETGDEDRLPIGSCVDSLVVDVRSGVSGTGMRMGVSVCRFKEEGVCLRRLINFGKMIRPAANVSREDYP